MSGDRQRSGRAGLEAQRRAIAAACRRQRWQLLELVEQIGRTAEDVKRPGIAEPLPLLEAGDKQALVAAKRDRRSRLLLDLASLVATAQQQGWALVALDCALEPTPAEEAIANLLATFAPFERQLISQRTREALAAKRAHGVRLGRPPTISQYAIDRIRRERNAGKSLAAIANGLNADRIPTAQGGRRWYPTTIRYTLNRTNSPPTPSLNAGSASATRQLDARLTVRCAHCGWSRETKTRSAARAFRRYARECENGPVVPPENSQEGRCRQNCVGQGLPKGPRERST